MADPLVRVPLATVAWVFLRLGATAFGGPAAHIALMEEEFVRRRQWLTQEHFLDLLAAVNLIPGPNSTEMAIHVGRVVAGWRGLLVAGLSFIVPAALLVAGIAWFYREYQALPEVVSVFRSVQPVVLVIVAQAVVVLGRSCLKSTSLVAAAVMSVVMTAFQVHEILVLAAAGAFVAASQVRPRRVACFAPLAVAPLAPPVLSSSLFWSFLKIGAILFGSGYVLVAYLRTDFVERHGWLTEAQLLDAVAVGQVTPGPVLTTATFIGYLLGGLEGAAVATAAIFLPAFVFVAVSGPWIPRLRRSATAGAFLDGVASASLAIMLVAGVQLGYAALTDVWSVAVALVGFLVLMRWKVNSIWLIVGALAVGAVRWWVAG